MKKITVSLGAVVLFFTAYFIITYLDLSIGTVVSKLLAAMAISSLVLFRINRVKIIKERA
jgi:hypothetical protein